MTNATQIVDRLLDQLREIPEFATAEQVVDSDPQIDQHTPLPVAHLRELLESRPERRGRDWRRTRSLQLDLYQAASIGRAGRDALLDAVLAKLVPGTTGVPIPGLGLISMSVGTITLEPEEAGSDLLLTQIPISIEYTASL